MESSDILQPESVRCEPRVGSKKHALEILSEMLADAAGGPSAVQVLEGLVSRERLGSTGLGGSVAMPHTKQPGVRTRIGAVLKLDEPVEFNAPDGEPVDLLVGLLVPEDSAADEVADVLERVRNLCRPEIRSQLRGCEPERLYDLFAENLRPSANSPRKQSNAQP